MNIGTAIPLANDPSWSLQQQAIFGWFETPNEARALLIRARAGTGKTTTIIEGINRAPELDMLLCCFNSRIRDELKDRVINPYASVMTLHALGRSEVVAQWGSVEVDSERGNRLAQKAVGSSDKTLSTIIGMVAKLAKLGKEMAPFAKKLGDLTALAQEFECIPDETWEKKGWNADRVELTALAAMELATVKDGTIDFSDMLFLPVRMGWVTGKYDLVVVDECQDMNISQIELAQRLMKKGGRIAVVGDDRQAIYRFRGADSGSLDRLKVALNARELPLTVTYRCPKNVVAEAQRLVPDYEAAATAPEGVVSSLPISKLAETAQPGDAILSRANAPLVRVCLSLLKRGVRAKVEGRDVGRGLVAIITKLKAKSLADFLEKLTKWEGREVEKAQKLPESRVEAKVGEMKDRADTLRALAEGLESVAELKARIEDLFSDDVAKARNVVVCSSVHRAKGLEWNRVFVLWATLMATKAAQMPERLDLMEEQNIEYVAITRAKRELVKVEGKNW